MRIPRRLLALGTLGVSLTFLPASGLAADRPALSSPGSAAPAAAIPNGGGLALIPGATVETIDIASVIVTSSAGSDLRNTCNSTVCWVYSAGGNPIVAPLNLPSGATLWQIDVYGYATATALETWYLLDNNVATGGTLSKAATAYTGNGTGILPATMTFAGGLTLAPGHAWMIDLPDDGPTFGFVGAVVQYTLPTISLVPITPVRVFDSRFSSRIAQGAPRTIEAKNAINVTTGATTVLNAIPQGARAITFTVTVTNTSPSGYVAVLPGTTTTVTASTVNWDAAGRTVAAGGTVSLGTGPSERQVTLVVGGPGNAGADVIVDVTGYYK